MTRAIKLLNSSLTGAIAFAKRRVPAISHLLNLHFNINQFNPTTMTKTQLNYIFDGTPPANPFRENIQHH